MGPTANFAKMPTAGKWLLVACQLLGRLELYSLMSLLHKHLSQVIMPIMEKTRAYRLMALR